MEENPLNKYVRLGQYERLMEFSTKDSDPNNFKDGTWPPLHLACISNGPEITFLKVLNALFLLGADPNLQTSSERNTALMYACTKNNPLIVERLLDNGADPKIRNSYGLTALDYACHFRQVSVVKVMLEKGVDPNDNDGKVTALLIAISNQDSSTVEALLEGNADPNQINQVGISPAILSVLFENSDLVRMLGRRGANFYDPSYKNQSAYDIAKQIGNVEIMGLISTFGRKE